MAHSGSQRIGRISATIKLYWPPIKILIGGFVIYHDFTQNLLVLENEAKINNTSGDVGDLSGVTLKALAYLTTRYNFTWETIVHLFWNSSIRTDVTFLIFAYVPYESWRYTIVQGVKTTTVQSTSIGSRGLIDYAINGVSIFVLF